MTRYRVIYRQRATDAWQSTSAASLQDAERQARGYRRRFWLAAVQWWNDAAEGRWVG